MKPKIYIFNGSAITFHYPNIEIVKPIKSTFLPIKTKENDTIQIPKKML